MGVADTPLRLRQAEQQLVAMAIDEQTPDRFSEIVASQVSPSGDIHGSAEYRKHLLTQLAKRALRAALAMKG
jgi:carbon-monoxide dehydrogenase medium subunit